MPRKVLIYATERIGLTAPQEDIVVGDTLLQFEPLDTPSRFQEFDGVVVFQGAFERFERKTGYNSYLAHTCERNELDKRKKEAALLAKRGGVLCFILVRAFIDRDDGRNFEGTDLAKFHLNYSSFYRRNYGNRVAHLRILRDEFRQFLEVYGAASTYFENYNEHIGWKVIAEAGGRVCGMAIGSHDYFVPSLIPDNRPETLRDYFSKLCVAVQTTAAKLDRSVPTWVNEFEFDIESTLKVEINSLEEKIKERKGELDRLDRFKGILSWSGDQLVAGVAEVLSAGLNFPTDTIDEFREDLKLLNEEGEPWCVVEVKGISRGVKREHINQADSHRERSGFSSVIPALLVANVAMRAGQSIAERDKPIADEQIRHARNMNVLVIRTLDLLRLVRLYWSEAVSREDVRQLFSSESGWVRVSDSGWEVVTGTN